ncbi:DUF6348 family protein [Frateuria aurantia]
MNQEALQRELLKLFEAHGVELEVDDEWLVTEGEFPAVSAQWQPPAAGGPGWLDVDVVLSEERQIEVSFPGHGQGEAGVREALQAFEREALHVLLASCWYVTDDRRIQLQSWELGLRSWDVFAGQPVLSPEDAAMPEGWLAALGDAMRQESPSAELHWLQIFQRRDAEDGLTREVLLDNEPWARGEQALAALNWPASGTVGSFRGFVALDIRDY